MTNDIGDKIRGYGILENSLTKGVSFHCTLYKDFTIQMVKKGEFTYAAGEDADKAALLAQLLKSKNKQDLETANKMIKVIDKLQLSFELSLSKSISYTSISQLLYMFYDSKSCEVYKACFSGHGCR